MNISRDEAAAALASVRRAEASARDALRAHHGHLHLWMWGAIWIVMCLNVQFRGVVALREMPWFTVGGMVASVLIGFLQSTQVRQPPDRRYLGALAAMIGFALVLPFVLRLHRLAPEQMFAYSSLVVAQCYVLSGIWFNTYLTWCGLALALLVLAGVFLFPAIFWLWIAVSCGGLLIGTGFYVRYFWR